MCVYVADSAFLKAFCIRNQVISNNVGVLVYSGTSYSKMNIFRGLLHTKMVLQANIGHYPQNHTISSHELYQEYFPWSLL